MSDEHNPSSRRLSAIMFTDLVGYSALTQLNETLALNILETHNTLLRKAIATHNGVEVKTIGDAFLVEFTSALNAVECAIEMQRTLREWNKTVEPAKHIVVRIGVHVGDVVHVGNDVLGDGVNIASRIQPFAQPGGICLSEDVARQVQNKIPVSLREVGYRHLKNITTPVRLFYVQLPWQTFSLRSSLLGVRIPGRGVAGLIGVITLIVLFLSTWNPFGSDLSSSRIAVLPLRNLSENREDEYFAEGITEELVSSLSKISGLEVIASSSVGRYREASLSFHAIGEQLRSGSLLEGSVRRWSDTTRVTIRLVDAASERLVWSENYNRPFRDILNVQNEIAMQVAGALKVQLLDAEKSDLIMDEVKNHEAWRFYLLSRHHLARRTTEDIDRSLAYARQALTFDPDFAPIYVSMAEAYTLQAAAGYGNTPRDVAVAEAERSVQKALSLNPRLAEAHAVYAYIRFRLQWKWNDADSLFQNAIALKPSYAKAHEWYGLYLALVGRYEPAIAEMRRAFDLDPNSASVGTGLGRVYSFSRQFDKAIVQLSEVLREHPNYAEAYFALGLAHLHGGGLPQAIRYFESAAQLSDRRPVIIADLGYAYARAGRVAEARSILRELDSLSVVNPAAVTPWVRSVVHLGLGEIDVGLDLMEQSYREHDGFLVYLSADVLPEVKDQPRFKALLTNIGFPAQ